MIDKETIDKIFATADIVEVIGEFVNLKRVGQNYRGFSPFTNEKNPSFFVSPSKQIFKCFSTGKGGNVVTFLMEHEKLSYADALKYLARKYNIEIKESEPSEEDIKLKNDRESMLALNEFANSFFVKSLHKTDEGKSVGLGYFYERGFREDIIRKFSLGYSPLQANSFTNEAIKNGFKKEFLLKTGLSIERNGELIDRFHGRVIFPIHSLSGQIIAFGGRILKSDDKIAKYINSPDSELYHKSFVLYGLFFARHAIVKNDKCYLVEGYTDVISMHQVGIENVVASAGTSLTIEQIRLIKRFTNNITIIYDGDTAGINASLRGINLVLSEGLNVKVVLLPDGEDPDSFSKKVPPDQFFEYIQNNEKDFITFKANLLLKNSGNDPVKKVMLINDIVSSIAEIPDSIARDVYIRECSRILQVNESLLYSEVRKIRRKKAEDKLTKGRYEINNIVIEKEDKNQPTLPVSQTEIIERDIIRLLLNYGNNEVIKIPQEDGTIHSISVAKFIVSEITHDELEFSNPVYAQIFNEIKEKVEKNELIDQKYFIYHQDQTIACTVIDLITYNYDLSKIWKKNETYVETEEMKLPRIVPSTILAFKNQKIMEFLKEAQKQLEIAEKNNDQETIEQLQNRIIILNEIKKDFAKHLGERIIMF